jgi:quinol monooxygenase YgiN
MAIKVIVELTVQPGRRDEFVTLINDLMAQHSSLMNAAGWHESTLHAVVDDPDKIIEISEWDSAEARNAAMQSEAMGAFAPVFALLAAPFNATVVLSCTRYGTGRSDRARRSIGRVRTADRHRPPRPSEGRGER